MVFLKSPYLSRPCLENWKCQGRIASTNTGLVELSFVASMNFGHNCVLADFSALDSGPQKQIHKLVLKIQN